MFNAYFYRRNFFKGPKFPKLITGSNPLLALNLPCDTRGQTSREAGGWY